MATGPVLLVEELELDTVAEPMVVGEEPRPD